MTARRKRHGRHQRRAIGLFRTAIRLIALGIILWACGFIWFAFDARRTFSDIPKADGIVVLTGGQDRIDAALDLLRRGRGQLLLISGVGVATTRNDLTEHHADHQIPTDMLGRITLGRRAVSTVGNADETAQWVRANHLHSLIVVTAGYHIRRAMLEIGRALPGITLQPYRVQPPALRNPWSQSTLRLLVREYDKWLGASLGLAREFSIPVQPPTPGNTERGHGHDPARQ